MNHKIGIHSLSVFRKIEGDVGGLNIVRGFIERLVDGGRDLGSPAGPP